ncbi:MAG: tRNA-guanine(34) transglycosylase [Gammaproteobacteria bacterium RIFCSPHIGHO2_12_FULL_42_10]|nr:MAG: tRNA-guanine(34) transglycosylase [Gammaproteobacteria bacterium RIFCSPHIGHO2_12_FULL_42_10]
MPVGTKAALNYLTPADLKANGTQIVLGGNTYHMLCAPGMEMIEKMGGMHRLMGWDLPMLTDSGGFQVLSLSKNSKICKIDEDGARFKHPMTHKVVYLNAKTSIEAQKTIGADIIMAFDECTPEIGGFEAAMKALDRTHRWLLLSKETHERSPTSLYGSRQALFGIIQGGSFRALREQSTAFILEQDLDGIAIGGEIIGFDMSKTGEIIDWISPMLPENKVRYTMGVGLHPQDLIDVVAKGIDMFDCVAPTRNARHGTLYQGRIVKKDGWLSFQGDYPNERRAHILIKKREFVHDERPIMVDCDCYTCKHFSRAYLHYLFKEKLMAYFHLACIHNVHVMQTVCTKMREIIERG